MGMNTLDPLAAQCVLINNKAMHETYNW